MAGNSAHVSTQRVPCAYSLQYYLRQTNLQVHGHDLSQGERQMAFQHWVAYIRGGDCGHLSDVTAKEYLTCPLLWCRESFDSLASTLQHVSECLWLSNGCYWCPYCCRPESFLASEEPSANPMPQNIQRKNSKLRRAVTFFKHLGIKSASRRKTLGSSAVYEAESIDNWLAKRRRPEMADTSCEIPSLFELENNVSDYHGHVSSLEDHVRNIYEMGEATIGTMNDLDRTSWCSQEADSDLRPCELDVCPSSDEPQPTNETSDPANFFAGIGTQFKAAPHDDEPMADMLVSPASTVASPFNHQNTDIVPPLHVKINSPNAIYSDTDDMSLPEAVNHHYGQPNVAPLFPVNENNLRDIVTVSTKSQVNYLRETVCIVNTEWLRRCQSTMDLARRASELSLRSVLDQGAQALQSIFRNVLPTTFEAVFSLAQISCAVTYIIHGDGASHCWTSFFKDMLKLQELIQNENDARLLVQLVDLLWWPQRSSAQHSSANCFPDEGTGTPMMIRKPIGGLDMSSITHTDAQAPRFPTRPSPGTMLDSLKSGTLFQECSRFLDALEYAQILERNKKYPVHSQWYAQNHVTNIEEILRTIIYPLQHHHGIEALYDAIKYTAAEVESGSLRNVREVEVSLISNCKSYCLSPRIFKTYLDTVTSICDQIMHTAGPGWRNRHYVTDIDAMLASLLEMDNRERLGHISALSRRQIIVDTTLQAMPPPPTNAQSIYAAETQTRVGSTRSAVTSPTVTAESSPTNQHSSSASPQSSFSAPTPSTFDTNIARCHLCPAYFTGSLRDRNSNLRRHMRTSRDHGNAVGLVCTAPGCGAVFSRSDNLGKHVRTVHGGDIQLDGRLNKAGAGKRRTRDGDN